MFFNNFIETVINKDLNCDPLFKEFQFRRFVIKTRGKCLPTIKFLRDPLTICMRRPQQCLYNDNDYYLALDSYSKTYYICYRTLLMIDMDLGKDGGFTEVRDYQKFLQEYCDKNKDILLDLYKTRNGVHCFVLDKEHNFKSDASLQLMLDLKCDFYYIVYSSIRGWSVRVNRKYMDIHDNLYEPLGRIGHGKPIAYLEKLVNLHLGFSGIFKDMEVSLMK